MGDWVRIVGWSIVSALKSQRDLTLENVALRHQLMVLQPDVSGPNPGHGSQQEGGGGPALGRAPLDVGIVTTGFDLRTPATKIGQLRIKGERGWVNRFRGPLPQDGIGPVGL